MKDKKIKDRDLYIIILAMVVMLGFCFVKINSLSDEIDDLKRDYVMEDDILQDQINSIYRNVDEQMKKQASLITPLLPAKSSRGIVSGSECLYVIS